MNSNAAKLFKETVSAGGKRIKLLGDSITHGVSGTGFQQNGEHIVERFYRNPDGYCWAKLISEYLREKYGCETVNNACTGTDIQFIIRNFAALTDENDDLVICTIGTNNRHQYFDRGPKQSKEEYLGAFYGNIVKLSEMFKAAKLKYIFVANIPASDQNEKDGENYWRIFHMSDVNEAYKKASIECGFPLISMYDLFSEYCRENAVSKDSLLKDGLHPNDQGYTVIAELFKKALEI